MLPLISVIVPVYNTVKYLDRCMKSILNQNYSNLEILLVDDGSTDGSAERCDFYAAEDSRVCVIHKENGGQSSARNAGLDLCRGEYISFVDSDDWIEPEMYSTLVNQLILCDAGLAICGRYDAYENNNHKTIGKILGKNGLFDAYQLIPYMINSELSDFSVCDKLHRRDLWNNIRFPEGTIYEDLAVMYKVVLAAKSVVLCDVPFYVYYHRTGSTVTAGFRESLFDYPKHTKQLLGDISSWYPEYTNYAIWSHIKAIQVVLIKLLRAEQKTINSYENQYRRYVKEIKSYSHVWKRDPLFSVTDRIICEVLQHKSLARLILTLKKTR